MDEGLQVLLYQLYKGTVRFLLSCKALDDPHAGEILVDKGI